MIKIINNKFRNIEIFKSENLIYFAMPAAAKQSASEKLKISRTLEKRRLEKELQKNMPDKWSALSGEFKTRNLDEDFCRKAYEIARDPNKMGDKEKGPLYRNFFEALAKGRFPDRGELMIGFLDAIEGGEKERSYAKEALEALCAGTILSERTEKKHLKHLHELRQQDSKEKAEREVGGKAMAIVEAAETAGRVEKIAGNKNKRWEAEAIDPEMVKKIEENLLAQYELIKEEKQLYEQIKDKQEKLKNNPPEKEAEKLRKEISELETKILEIDKKTRELGKEVQEPMEKDINHFKRLLAQFKAIEELSKQVGIDIAQGMELKIWYLRAQKKGDGNLDVENIVIERKTKNSEREKTKLKINKIHFDTNNCDNESAGKMVIECTMEDGDKSEDLIMGYDTFIHYIDTFEGYEEINDIEKFNEMYEEELAFKDIRQTIGEKFTKQKLVNAEQEKYEEESLEIVSVEQIKGKWMVKLNKSVTKTNATRLPLSTHLALFTNREQNEFELGEFGSFLRKNEYQRKPAKEEMEEIARKLAAKRKRDSENQIKKEPDTVKKHYEQAGGIIDVTAKTGSDRQGGNVVFLEDRKQGQGKRNGHTPILGRVRGEEYGTTSDTTAAYHSGGPSALRIQKSAGKKGYNIEVDRDALAKSLGTHHAEESQEKEETPHETEESAGNEEESDTGKQKEKDIDKEALPYEKVNKYGDMEKQEQSFLASAWTKTHFLSVDDIWEMGKAMYEYYERRFERSQKIKIGDTGKDIPFFSPEMKRIKQASENEMVNQCKESYAELGDDEILEIVINTNNKDEFRAGTLVLSEKGQMRWDDIEVWKNLNRFTDPSKAIPIPTNGDPYTKLGEHDNRTGFDLLEDAYDSIWGKGTYSGMYSQNKSKYLSNAKGFYEKGDELEGLSGEHGLRLQTLLHKHKDGEYVNPHEYEGLIMHAIERGKISMPEKLYYIIEGIGAVNHKGKTIFSFDRVAHINSNLLANFPLLDFLTYTPSRPGGEDEGMKFTKDDYVRWVHWFDGHDHMNSKPTKAVNEFLWKHVIPNKRVHKRINKDLRHADKLDHDDMFAYLPPATERVITDACATMTGDKKLLTVEGYKNAFPGFSQYMRSLAENDNRQKLLEAVKSYVRFEGIMMDKYDKGNLKYQRMGDGELDTPCVMSKVNPRSFIAECNGVIRQVISAYGDTELDKWASDIFDLQVGEMSEPNEKKKQDQRQKAYANFGKKFTQVVKSDGGQKMTAIIAGANLYGMPDSKTLSKGEMEKRKIKSSTETELDD